MDESSPIEVQLRELNALIDAGNFSELLARTEHYLAQKHLPERVADLHRTRAVAHTGLSDWKSAVAEWTKVVEILPERATSYLGRAAARERADDSQGAVADFVQAAELYIHPISHKAAIKIESTPPRTSEVDASDSQACSYPPHGFCCCGGGHQGPQIESAGYQKRGFCALAESSFTHMIEESPDDIDAWFNRASVRHCKRNWDGVIADCTQVVTRDSSYAKAYTLRGSAYDKKGRIKKAIADWTCAIVLDPEDMMAYSLRAMANNTLDQDEQAQADRIRAFELRNGTKSA